MHAILDADLLAYIAASMIEHTVYTVQWGGSVYSTERAKEYKEYLQRNEIEEGEYTLTRTRRTEPVEAAYYNIKTKIAEINEHLNSDSYTCIFSGGDNFRKRVNPNYKANRNDQDKAIHLDDVQEYVRAHHPYLTAPDCEADDLMGMLQYKDWQDSKGDADKCDTVLVTTDKDLDTIPGYHYNPNTKEFYWLDEDDCEYNFWWQVIVGDSADHVKGAPGAGPKKAEEILTDDCEWYEDAVLSLYYAKVKDDLEAEQQFDINKTLIRIARTPDEIPVTEFAKKQLEKTVYGTTKATA